jgi:hypothetical protein
MPKGIGKTLPSIVKLTDNKNLLGFPRHADTPPLSEAA